MAVNPDPVKVQQFMERIVNGPRHEARKIYQTFTQEERNAAATVLRNLSLVMGEENNYPVGYHLGTMGKQGR